MPTKTTHKIIHGDSRKMAGLENNSVDLVITSPPYWQLKDYGPEGQIGYHDTYQDYINNLNLVWNECYRVLNNGCRLCVNIGDQFARAAYYGRYKVIPIRTEIIKFCEAIGFDYLGAIIWQKKTTTNTSGGASLMGSYPLPRNGVLSIDYEFILLFKKLGTPSIPDKALKEQSKMTKEEWKEYFAGHWHFGGAKQKSHIAMFPEELPKRLIKMFSFVGDMVLDPFLGSGTTSLAAKKLNRNSVGYEMNPEYIPYIEKKLDINQGDIFNPDFSFIKQGKLSINFKDEIGKLPYVFKDFHQFDKKTDPKKKQFGSKIDKNKTASNETYFRVKEVISPELVKLNNDQVVRLIGIKEKKNVTGEAIAFLKLKTKGQKVFIKQDQAFGEKEKPEMVYLYLKNKTFLNAHLIKKGLADVDLTYEYKHKKRLIGYRDTDDE